MGRCGGGRDSFVRLVVEFSGLLCAAGRIRAGEKLSVNIR